MWIHPRLKIDPYKYATHGELIFATTVNEVMYDLSSSVFQLQEVKFEE